MKSGDSRVVSWDCFLFHAGELECIDNYLAVKSKAR